MGAATNCSTASTQCLPSHLQQEWLLLLLAVLLQVQPCCGMAGQRSSQSNAALRSAAMLCQVSGGAGEDWWRGS
jgi:hypothetical protein